MACITQTVHTRRDNGTMRLTGASTAFSGKPSRLLRHDQHRDHIFPVISVTSLGRAVFTAPGAAHHQAQLQILHSHAGNLDPRRSVQPPEPSGRSERTPGAAAVRLCFTVMSIPQCTGLHHIWISSIGHCGLIDASTQPSTGPPHPMEDREPMEIRELISLECVGRWRLDDPTSEDGVRQHLVDGSQIERQLGNPPSLDKCCSHCDIQNRTADVNSAPATGLEHQANLNR